jgi:hypothetical protein
VRGASSVSLIDGLYSNLEEDQGLRSMAIKSTFNVVKAYIPAGMDPSADEDAGQLDDVGGAPSGSPQVSVSKAVAREDKGLNLVYNINVIIPETSDLRVLNAIFRSLKENLLQ